MPGECPEQRQNRPLRQPGIDGHKPPPITADGMRRAPSIASASASDVRRACSTSPLVESTERRHEPVAFSPGFLTGARVDLGPRAMTLPRGADRAEKGHPRSPSSRRWKARGSTRRRRPARGRPRPSEPPRQRWDLFEQEAQVNRALLLQDQFPEPRAHQAVCRSSVQNEQFGTGAEQRGRGRPPSALGIDLYTAALAGRTHCLGVRRWPLPGALGRNPSLWVHHCLALHGNAGLDMLPMNAYRIDE
jgi:hypothetical protein